MNVGIDIGYSATKVKGPGEPASFPSIVGTPERARFSLDGHIDDIVLDLPDGRWLVGQGAVEQSRFASRREDRGWIESNEYYRLMLAAFTQLTAATACDMVVVSGLPVAFYDDRATLRDRFLGQHRATREGRRAQLFRVTQCRIIPQPFGALLAAALDDRGHIVDDDLATGAVGVIDVGGKTTNLLSVNRLSEIATETASVNVGAWDATRAVADFLASRCPNLELKDHRLMEAIIARQVKYYGEPIDLSEPVDAILEPMAEQVISQATQLWNGGASLDAILVAGGGALLLGPAIQRHFRHARTVYDPVYANVVGYWRFAQRLGS
jgi:PRTRC genetic system protein D